MAKSKEQTPLMRQYNSIKSKYPDALLLFRVGDFYETFGEDAIKCANILDIVLTKRANGSAAHIELAGFPHHALNTYLPKLVRAGLRVAICDQLEDPKQAKGIVKRGVTELVTPGVALDDSILSSKSNNFLMALYHQKNNHGVALLDISTGEFLVTEANTTQLNRIVQSFQPKELVYDKRSAKPNLPINNMIGLDDWAFQLDYATDKITSHFKVNNLKGFGVASMPLAIVAAGAIFAYLEDTHHKDLNHITNIQRIDQLDHVWMDSFTIRNLELFNSPHNNAVSLLDVLDKTCTPMGARRLKQWLAMVLVNIKSINQRKAVVQFFVQNLELKDQTREILSKLPDFERLSARIATNRITPKQLFSLQEGLQEAEQVFSLLKNEQNADLNVYLQPTNNLETLQKLIQTTLSDDPPHYINKGNVIRTGANAELDQLRKLQHSGKDFLENMRAREEEKTGIPKLKIAFNNVFGYYLEVRNTHKDKVPTDWVRKQTLVNAERYITAELKEYEDQILGAEEKIIAIETKLYENLVNQTANHLKEIQNNAQVLAQLDVLSNFAHIAIANNYTQAQINQSFDLHIEQGRHPVIEKHLPAGEPYISNTLSLNKNSQQIIMVTGPNMSGKSALLRQTALIVIMAQIGSYVPAKNCQIGLVDKIFTRVGASDNISTGESTFMVEMNETASILNNLSDRSLILLDEIGRGTSTFDGISIAWSVAEFLHQHPFQPKTLFATHYHELNEMAKTFDRIKNYNVSIKEIKDKVVFLRKLKPGGSEHSFGIHVAKMAGMPKAVVKRSEEILKTLEGSPSKNNLNKTTETIVKENMQLSFFQLDDPILEAIREELLHTDINTLTPIEALMKLHEIRKKLGA